MSQSWAGSATCELWAARCRTATARKRAAKSLCRRRGVHPGAVNMVRSPDFCTIGGAVLLLKRLPDGAGRRRPGSWRCYAARPPIRTAARSTSDTVAVRAGRGLSGGVGRGGVEAPSTPIGDPFEYASLAEVYGTEGPCALASVNTNFGHSAINYFFRVNWLTSM